ncbi:hypothetical protein SLS62_001044 [Diatrype stigma]|uniref:Cytochrome P450 n=1 Tax=Diatrype stigma TaxID=117547 RepID=A0AAN9VBF5_9PEZI
MEPLFMIGGALAVLVLQILIKRLIYPRPLPGIPYNKDAAKSITGDRPFIAATYKKFTEWSLPIGRRSLEYGSPVHQVFLTSFAKPIVLVDDPREVSDMLLRRQKEFDKSNAHGIWKTFIPDSTIAKATTEEYKAQRRTWQDAMNPDFLRRVVAKTIYDRVVDLTRLWAVRSSRSSGSAVDVSEDFSFAALDAIWTATFGEHLDLVNSQIQALETGKKVKTKGLDMHSTVQYLDQLATVWRGALWPAFTRWRLQRNANFRRYMQMKDREIDRILLDASARFQRLLDGSSTGEEHDTCAMDLVLRRNMLAAQKAGKQVPDPTKDSKLRDELLLFIYAGHDTTSTTLQWFVKYMTNNQEVQTKLREKLRTAYSGSPLPDVEELLSKDVPYLNATIEETLRLASTASRLGRTATVDTEILGHKIPAGTEVSPLTVTRWTPVPVPESCRSASSRAAFEKAGGQDWAHQPSAQDLDEFSPERWLKTDEKGQEVFDSSALPQNAFGGGTRGCFGMAFGTPLPSRSACSC